MKEYGHFGIAMYTSLRNLNDDYSEIDFMKSVIINYRDSNIEVWSFKKG